MSARPRQDHEDGAAPSARGERGFTLIEILLSMLIFMAGVAGIYGLMSTALGMQRKGLDASTVTRRLEGVVVLLEQQLSDGQHWNATEGRWEDVPAERLPDGTWYRVAFVPEEGNEADGTLLAELRLAGSEAGLDRARPVSYLLSPGPTAAAAVAAYRSGAR